MILVRPADRSDLAWLFEQLRAFAAFYGTRHSLFPDDDGEARAALERSIATECYFLAVRPVLDSAAAEDERLGFISGVLFLHPRKPAIRVLSETFWWVAEAHRGSSAGARLLEHFIAYGRLHADWILMTLEAASPVSDRILIKRGFAPRERTYLLEVLEVA